MDSLSMKKKKNKKHYTPPTITELSQEQAEKLVADFKNCSKEEAAEFLQRLRKQSSNDATDQQKKRSA
jgi:hypothetical protein